MYYIITFKNAVNAYNRILQGGNDMANILLNKTDFHESWAGSALQYLLPETSRVLIIPLSSNSGWGSDARVWEESFRKGRRLYEALVRPFRAYGITDEQIRWINYYEDDEMTAESKIRSSDVIYLVGSNPAWMMQRLEDLDMVEKIRGFRGVVMGAGAGALIQMREFPVQTDYDQYMSEGLGLVSGIDLYAGYQQTMDHLERLIRMLEDGSAPVVVMSGASGALIDGKYFDLLGEAMLLNKDHLDEIYAELNGGSEGWGV